MIRPGTCISWLKECFRGVHSESDDYYIALYTNDADLSPQTETYVAVGEVQGQGYKPGGVKLYGFTVSGDTAACLDFDNVTIPNATIAADGALIYNKSAGGKAVAVVRFAGRITSTNAPFDIEMPRPGDATSLIYIS